MSYTDVVLRSRSHKEAPVNSRTNAHHEPRDLSDDERSWFRQIALAAQAAKKSALSGKGPEPVHEINRPVFDPEDLMPIRPPTGITALSLFSGGGGLDLGFERAGFPHVAAYEILEDAAATLQKANPEWNVHGGSSGDVTKIDWTMYRDEVSFIHGGPPCQPFSSAGRQRGSSDSRNMFPEFVRAVLEVQPLAFMAENVAALAARKFADYVRDVIVKPLSKDYTVRAFELKAAWFGVPQVRRRLFFVGFKDALLAARWKPPSPTHVTDRLGEGAEQPAQPQTALLTDEAADSRPNCMGVRQALGLPDISYDALAPTIRSSLTGPRHTTSINSSVAAQKLWFKLGIWPHGVATSRHEARLFVPRDRHFRLAIPDVALIQGFPEWWPFVGPTYMVLGQIGNAVPPPMAYAVAQSIAQAVDGGS